MAIFVKLSISRRNLMTTIAVVQLFMVFAILATIQRNMQTVEIFSVAYEWHPTINTERQEYLEPIQTAQETRQDAAILTLFTTFQDNIELESIHENLIKNWAALRPHLQPVLFVDRNTIRSQRWAELAERSGWSVRNVTKTNRGIPTLRHMYMEVLRTYHTPFYGYARSDILFDHSLVEDMKFHSGYIEAYQHHSGLLLIGKRTEITLDRFSSFDAADTKFLSFVGENNGTLSKTYSEDYLITTHKALPWEYTPDLVIGQAGYGKWLVVKAQICNVTVIDASYTIMALHQSMYKDTSNEQIPRCINQKLVGMSRFDCSKGITECAPYVSHRDANNTLKLYKRPDRPAKCSVDSYDDLCREDLGRYVLYDDSFM